MKTFKFFKGYVHYEYTLPIARRGAGRTIANELVPVQPLGPPDNDVRILRNSLYGALGIRDVAVISASRRDFNNWKRENFTPSEAPYITGGEFLFTDPHNNVTTRYRAIMDVSQCEGLIFDEYISTNRTMEILTQGNDDYVIDFIRELITEVKLHMRDETI